MHNLASHICSISPKETMNPFTVSWFLITYYCIKFVFCAILNIWIWHTSPHGNAIIPGFISNPEIIVRFMSASCTFYRTTDCRRRNSVRPTDPAPCASLHRRSVIKQTAVLDGLSCKTIWYKIEGLKFNKTVGFQTPVFVFLNVYLWKYSRKISVK